MSYVIKIVHWPDLAVVLRKGQGDLIAISFKVISSPWSILHLQYEYLGIAGKRHEI